MDCGGCAHALETPRAVWVSVRMRQRVRGGRGRGIGVRARTGELLRLKGVCLCARARAPGECAHAQRSAPLPGRVVATEMQDPNADTEWNDILRKKGILPPKDSLQDSEQDAEEEQRALQQSVVKTYEDMTLEELEDNEDEFNEEDERAIEMYRQQRLAEWKATQLKNQFGEVLEISGKDYVQEVTRAGKDLWVVLHLYKQGIPLCALINQHFSGLARKFPNVKFVKAISTTCIPNYPDRNLPTVFVYLDGDIKAQYIGPLVFGGMNLTRDELEWKLAESGAVKTDLEENPKKHIEDVLLSSVRVGVPMRAGSDSEED